MDDNKPRSLEISGDFPDEYFAEIDGGRGPFPVGTLLIGVVVGAILGVLATFLAW